MDAWRTIRGCCIAFHATGYEYNFVNLQQNTCFPYKPYLDTASLFKMGHDLVWQESGAWLYMSFNFSVFREYWHVGQAHGHTGKTISRQLHAAISRLSEEGVVAGILHGEDGYSATKNVFLDHLFTFYGSAMKHYTDRLYSDKCWVVHTHDEGEGGYTSDGVGKEESDEEDEEEEAERIRSVLMREGIKRETDE
jgi:hypothetical protein